MIITADHQPVARIRIAQHRIGDGYIILHLAAHRKAQRLRGSFRSLPAALPAGSCALRAAALLAAALAGRRLGPDDKNARNGNGHYCHCEMFSEAVHVDPPI